MRIILFLLSTFVIFSCKSESEKLSERNNLIDSTIYNFQTKLIKTALDSVFAEENFNASVLITRDSIVIYKNMHGFADYENKRPFNENTIFAIASISKQFTATLILELVAEGKISLDDKVSKYLPHFEKNSLQDITILQLLNHTSGLNDYSDFNAFEAGTDFKYSNKGYNYLGEIIAVVTGKSYEENLSQLFRKTDMTNSFTPSEFKETNFASANYSFGQVVEPVPDMPMRLTRGDIGTAAGGILSNMNDLTTWSHALFNGKVLDSVSMKSFMTSYSQRDHFALGKVGYGLGIMMNENPPKSFFHTGYVKGAPSLLVHYPDSKTTVVILSNFADESKGKEVIFRPHQRIKDLMDYIEITVAQLKVDMIKPVLN